MTTLTDEAIAVLKRIKKGRAPLLNEKGERLALQNLQIEGYIKLVEPPSTYKLTARGQTALVEAGE